MFVLAKAKQTKEPFLVEFKEKKCVFYIMLTRQQMRRFTVELKLLSIKQPSCFHPVVCMFAI